MKQRFFKLMMLPAFLVFAACSSSPYGMALDVRSVPSEAPPAIPRPDGLKVAVFPFIDERVNVNQLGMLHPLFGDPEPFTVSTVDLGQSLAEAFIDGLKRRERWRAWLEHPLIAPIEGGADMRLSGRVRECFVDAREGLFATTVEAVVALVVEVHTNKKANPFQVDAQGRVSRRVKGADGHKVEELLYEAIQQAVDQFLAATSSERLPLLKPPASSP